MSTSRTSHIALAVAVFVILPNALTLSATGMPRPIQILAITTPKAALGAATMPTIVQRSHLARHSSCSVRSGSSLSYHYPIKPFNRQHRIRGYFADPRTPSGKRSVFAPGARGPFNFHSGVDILAADGTPVYSVVSGKTIAHPGNVKVYTTDGRRFQYYHIVPSVHSGQHVVAYKTVIGHIQAPHGHVHLIEVDGRTIQNPLAPGHLEPYRDKTAPVVDGVHFTGNQGLQADPLRLNGVIHIAADTHDMPALPIVGNWPGLGVTPAAVTWELRSADGSVVVPSHMIVDFRRTEPGNKDFWKVFAVGTHQNKYGSKHVRRVTLVGLYSYNLTPSGLDTRTLSNGVYVLTVSAADTCGNIGSLSAQITIANGKAA
ncbi:MAG TPA: hypothetical protein VII05_07570 [Gaiellaceae bacterium]|jgi:hypothetical protein